MNWPHSEFGNQHLIINGVFTASHSEDPFAVAMQTRVERALMQLPPDLIALPRTTVQLSASGVIGLSSLRAMATGTDLEIPEATCETSERDLPRGLGSLIDDLAALGRGVILVMGKGGVGKTTVAAAVAVGLAARGHDVHLSTTDPAAHIAEAVPGNSMPNLKVSRIDPPSETRKYSTEIMQSAEATLDSAGLELLAEDLRSPCTEEIAVFRAFAQIVAEGQNQFVVLDTAPTGHTILLLDAAFAYHKEVSRQTNQMPPFVTELLPRLRDSELTRVLIVTLPEATPVHEAIHLQQDLRRAGIEPYAWVINQSLSPLSVSDPFLRSRQAHERQFIDEVADQQATRTVLVGWQLEPPAGHLALKRLCQFA